MQTYVMAVAAVLSAAAIALLTATIVHRVVRRLGRRSVLLAELAAHSHRPFRVALVTMAVQLAVRSGTRYAADEEWRKHLLHTLVILVIAATSWLIASLLVVTEDTALARYRVDVPDNRLARRIKTQIVMIRRVTIAFIVIVTIGAMLMTFPSVRTIGASLLASAGVIGVVGALAAQSLLGNVIAGLQLAFSDAVRLDDVVVVEGEWGRIEELTLSHVVVQIWDDRRLILPTSYFTTTPFQNWTRTRAALLGTAEFDVDWGVPMQSMREELRRIVEATDLWDGRVCVLQITDAVGGMVRVRALVSAEDAGSLFDLRCLVREALVTWVRHQMPDALPRLRTELGDARRREPWPAQPQVPPEPEVVTASDDARVFSGSDDGDARGDAFVGPDDAVERTEADPSKPPRGTGEPW
ncbi:mechanosensitive ion channel family protein [Micromonosporaceae bacterium DT55]|uniref:mechanosensitive ion channel family protein n=1 Tax=Melissospora conviva TaxID=3388432 RepID=UPI003C257ACA